MGGSSDHELSHEPPRKKQRLSKRTGADATSVNGSSDDDSHYGRKPHSSHRSRGDRGDRSDRDRKRSRRRKRGHRGSRGSGASRGHGSDSEGDFDMDSDYDANGLRSGTVISSNGTGGTTNGSHRHRHRNGRNGHARDGRDGRDRDRSDRGPVEFTVNTDDDEDTDMLEQLLPGRNKTITPQDLEKHATLRIFSQLKKSVEPRLYRQFSFALFCLFFFGFGLIWQCFWLSACECATFFVVWRVWHVWHV